MHITHAQALVTTALVITTGAFAESSTSSLAPVTVTGTREETLLAETPSAVSVVSRDTIQFTRPSHPQQLLGQIPGVAISVTNGEGHATAIRQGFTTSPLYLFLEDGIPIRATGNFNHNALYEVNIPSAGGVEVVRGIGSALYGSDAIGGVVNVLTRAPKARRGGDLSLEGGSFGWGRLVGGIDSGDLGNGALRADLNLTRTDGWRDKTAYDRQSANLRWDYSPDDATVMKTIFGITHIDQQTGANSALPLNLYLNNPTTNLRSPAYRIVDALRLSSSIDRDLGQGQLLTLTPYFRDNRMDLNGSYNFSSNSANARIEKTSVQSFGLMLKYRRNLDDAMRTRLILGMDLDYSPSHRTEDKITLSTSGAGSSINYTGYTIGARIYDYQVNYQSVAPYLHVETSPVEQLRLTFGLRYDYARYTMENQLAANTLVGGFYQLDNSSRDFQRISPKLGMTYAMTPGSHLFASYNQGFRTPSENQLFRSGANSLALADAALNLRPILAEQYELGVRGDTHGWRYEAVAYVLTKHDDLLGYKDASGVTVQTNNGSTRHKGIELGIGRQVDAQWRVDMATSYAIHRYLDWVASSTLDYSGKEIESSPRWLSNVRATWTPSRHTLVQLEWVKLGGYFLEASNANGKYAGHDLFNLRMSQQLDDRWTLFARIMNLVDKRYADSASYSSGAAMYSPGLPRVFYLGLEGKW
jgi:outer membrane receptor protein involved in Fe transport